MKHVELFEFFVEGRDQDLSHVLLHITEPSTREEFEKGYFFALVEIVGATNEQIERMQAVIDEIEGAYYETDMNEAHGKDVFEFVLESMNRHSADILDKKSEVHSIVGVIRDNHLTFSYHGLPGAMLFYMRGGEVAHMNLIEEQSREEEQQLFPSVLEGSMNDGDLFLVATPRVSQYFSSDRLQKILASRGLRPGTDHIQKVLHDLKDDASFGGMIVRVVPPEETPRTGKKPRSQEGSAESLNRLLASERETAETLSPPIFGNLAKKVSKRSKKDDTHAPPPKEKKSETNYRPRAGRDESSLAEVILIHLGRAVVFGARRLFGFIKTILVMLVRFMILLIILITNKNNGRGQIIGSMRRKWEDALYAVRTLPLVSKILFAGAMIFALVFVGSIGYMRVKENIEAEKERYAFTIEAIEDKKAAADAAMIYGDDAKAFDLIKEAELLLETLNTEEYREAYDRLQGDISETLTDLRNMTVIEPAVFADLTGFGKQTERLAMIDNTMLAYVPNEAGHFTINTNTASIEETAHDSGMSLGASATPKENDTIVFINNARTVAEYQKDSGAILERDISFPVANPTIVDGFIYNIKLYTLDPSGEQIYKHNKTQTGYDKGSPWVTQKTTSLADARALAIDSAIYVIKDSGDIVKFETGVEQPFSIKGLDPALDAPSEIWTYVDIDHIYILEPTNKRVVVLDKTGALVAQYTSPLWERPTDMIVDAENNMIYVLDRNKIYRFSLSSPAAL